MDYRSLFEKGLVRARALGAEGHIKPGRKVSRKLIAEARERMPESLVDLYASLGDEFRMGWSLGDAHGGFELYPPLASYPRWLDQTAILYSSVYDGYGDPCGESPTEQEVTLSRMPYWFPFFEDGDGSRWVVDTNEPSMPVLFCGVAWFDADDGTQKNGLYMAEDLPSFFRQWSEVGFRWLSYWPSVIDEDGVDWTADAFMRLV